ncbi:MAG: gamma-glutamyltransferase [Acidimicrobiia bacterium]
MTGDAVATPHRLSAEVGQKILLEGGNAVDAAVAMVTAQGVVAPETCGLGGDLFALVHRPGWSVPKTLNSSGRAGSNADAAAIRRAGHTEIPGDHPAVVTVPGCVDGLVTLNRELGSRPLGELLQPAIDLATRGFEVSDEQSRAFTRQSDVYRANPAISAFYPGGRPVSPGDHVTRSELAATLTRLAATGDRDDFYLGTPGEDIVAALGGIITMDDLARSQAEWVDPLGVEVFGMTAWTTPPNSQGYLGPASLAVFEILGPPDDPDDPAWWHLIIEAYRSMAWERDDLVADPGALPMPPGLIVERSRLERAAASVTDSAGRWPEAMGRVSGTAYMCAADSDGMGVSIIQSNYRGTGSRFGAARSGFLLHDRGSGFGLMPGHPNALAPGRRPLHTLSPTLWTRGEDPAWLIGTRGGAIQPQLVAQVAARALGGGADPVAALLAPRWAMAEFGPGSGSVLAVEPGVPVAVLEDLDRRGHLVTVLPEPQHGWGPVSMIGLQGERKVAAADPRLDTATALVF